MTDLAWDKKLNINTGGRDASKEDAYHYPYEPTPYCVLERLVDAGYLSDENIVIDYGSGKGRVGFFLNYKLGCMVIGVDFDSKMCELACKNLQNFGIQKMLTFICCGAEIYEIENADSFYFFNPFSVEILQSVIGKIIKSYYNLPRRIQLFVYYPSDEYIAYLMSVPQICFLDEIDCSDLFMGNNARERIMIFEIM